MFMKMEKFYLVKEVKLPPIGDSEGDMNFFYAFLCYIHLFPQNVVLEEIDNYDIDNPPKDKLVVQVSYGMKWDGYVIYYPTYSAIQCKYCSSNVNSEITKSCLKLGVKEIFKQLNSDFAQMIFNMLNVKILTTPTFIQNIVETTEEK